MFRIENLSQNWSGAIKDRWFIALAIVTMIFAVGIFVFLMNYFEYIQARPGVYLNDPILDRIPARNLSNYTFVFLYGSILFALAQLGNKPRLLIQAIQIYCTIILLRIVTLYLVPLEPASGMIVLRDPLIDYFVYNGKMISKDLFFSGHVSTVFLALLMVRGVWQKTVLAICTIIVAVLILMQHVHYTIDVVVAPVFTYISYYFVKKVYAKWPEWMGQKIPST